MFTCHNVVCMKRLQEEYIDKRKGYRGIHLPGDIRNIDAELVNIVISKLERGKAADIDRLSAEHLLFCNPIISVILAKLFGLIMLCRYVPTGFKFNYIVSVSKVKDYRTRIA